MAQRVALLIGNQIFHPESGLPPLRGPANDIAALSRLLGDPTRGRFEVHEFMDKTSQEVTRSIEQALNNAISEDLFLIYYSGHGRLDRSGRLYLATADTLQDVLFSTSVRARDLSDLVELSNCQQVVLVLDCCYSGAVGLRGDVGSELHIVDKAHGFYIMTASTGIQAARETETAVDGAVMGSFTASLVKGIESGAADRGRSGKILLSDLRHYLGQVSTGSTPQFFASNASGDPLISLSPATAAPKWDVFVSYASEDRDEVAWPLSRRLRELGLRVFLDRDELRLGDGIARKIDEGLANSRFGIVIISHAFLKNWPEPARGELAAFFDIRDIDAVIPIWHRVDHAEVAKFSPGLAAKYAVSTSVGIEAVGIEIAKDVYHFLGQGVFDEFYESDREWFLSVLKMFNRNAFRGRYVGWSGHEPFQNVIKGMTKTLGAGDVGHEGRTVDDSSTDIKDVTHLRDQLLFASMLKVSEQLKSIDNIITNNLPYPGLVAEVVSEIDRLRDDIILKMNAIWTVFRIHTLPIPTSVPVLSGKMDGTM